MTVAYLGLGSNLGSRCSNLERATKLLNLLGTTRASAWYETQPWGVPAAETFVNGVVSLHTALKPLELLDATRALEQELGRVARQDRARTIDIDLLFYGEQVICSKRLVLPHPRLAQRSFVLVPLAEIAPGLRHPVSGMSVSQMLRRVMASGVSGLRAA